MDEDAWLAERFEENRPHLRGVAYRMLGSLTEADDAVQEAWIRLSRTDTSDVDNLRAWLTTVVGRVCLNMLRSRRTRREASLETHVPDPVVSSEEWDRSRAGSLVGRFRRARDARRPRVADARRAGGVRPPRRLRGAIRRDRPDCRSNADGSAAARKPCPPPRPGLRPCQTSISMANGLSPTLSSPRRVPVTSSASSLFSTRMSWCAPMVGWRARSWSPWSTARRQSQARPWPSGASPNRRLGFS